MQCILPTIQRSQQSKEIIQDINKKEIAMLIYSTFYGALTISKTQASVATGIKTIRLLFDSLRVQ